MEQALGVKFTYVPFKGGGEVCVNLVGKHMDSTVNNPIECTSHWKTGRVRPLAVFDTARIRAGDWKAIPTVKEALGVDIHYVMLRGIFGPPDIPKEAVEWHIGFLKKVYDTPEFKKYLKDGALKPAFAVGAEYVKWVDENEKLHRDLMGKGGLLKKIACASRTSLRHRVDFSRRHSPLRCRATRLRLGQRRTRRADFSHFGWPLIMVVVCAVIIVQAARKPTGKSFVSREKLASGTQSALARGRRTVMLMHFVGLYVASALYIGFLHALGRAPSWVGGCRCRLRHPGGFSWFSRNGFCVPMPKGPLEQWLGY